VLTPSSGAVRTSHRHGRLTVTADTYRLEVLDTGTRFADSPYLLLAAPAGEGWVAIDPISSVDTTDAPDEVLEVGPLRIEELDGVVVLVVDTPSTAWRHHAARIVCHPDRVELSIEVEGAGLLDDVTLLGGRATLPSGAAGVFRSGIGFAGLFVPVPTEPVQVVRPADAGAALGVLGDADPGRFHGIFSPPPLVLGLGREVPAGPTDVPGGEWLGLSLRAPVERLTFPSLRYEPLDGGFLLRLPYEGHTRVTGSWTSPTVVLRPAESGYAVIDDHRADLAAHGFVPEPVAAAADWWSEPIFCGWGAQCARALHLLRSPRSEPDDPTAPESLGEEDRVVTAAPMLSSRVVYDEFLARLDEHGLAPGTVVIDDRWQAEYGTAEPDLDRWPDLGGWIAGRHAAGQRVLLWWKAWDPSGLPAEECVTDAAGRPVAVDPANPAYLARLRRIITRLLSPDGLDADGLKIDFTQRAPSGRTLRGAEGTWGIAALHRLLGTIQEAAKAVKPDSLVVCHTVHPSFGDVCDMVRLNDVLKHDRSGAPVPVVDQMRFRAEVVRRALPEHPIDTDQWPMPNREEWLAYAAVQPELGVPALYYLESIDRSGEAVGSADLERIRDLWAAARSHA
jgi:hypothetical protein